MRILIISTAYGRYNARTYYLQARTLAKYGHDVTILCSDRLPEETKNGIHIISIEKKVFDKRFARLTLSKKYIKRRLAKLRFDAVQIGSPECLSLAKYFRKQGVTKMVFDSRENHLGDIQDKKWIPVFLRPLISKLYERYEKKYAKMMDAVIVPTTFMLERFSSFHENVKVVTNYPLISENALTVNEPKVISNICFFGSLRKEDLHTSIFTAIRNIENINYNILSSGSERENDALLHVAQKMGVGNKVKIYPQVAYEDVPLFLQKNDIGIVMRKYTANYGYKRGSLGVIKFFQYLSLGMPIICTDYEEWKKVIDEFECGICVNPYDANAIEQAIVFLKSNIASTIKMGQNSRRAFETKFNWEAQEKTYVEVFEKIV